MVAVYCGNKWNPKSGRIGAPLAFDLESNFELIAPPGSGKGASLEIPNLLVGLRKCSVLSIDPSGQNAAVCAEARRLAGNDVLSLNPMGLHVARYPDLESVGCNPMSGIGWRSVFFYQDCAAISEALIKLENDSQVHFPQSARGLITGLVMWEVLKAAREDRAPLLENVRAMLCEPETRDPYAPDLTDEEQKAGGRLKSGLRFHAACMIASGHWQISDLAGRYVKEGSREIDSIISTARTQTEWLLSEPMRGDLRKNGVNWSQLAEKPTTVFVIIPAEFLETQEGSVWLRLIIMCALRVLYGRAGRRKVRDIVFMLSEFAALGKLKAVEAARSQGRKYGIRLWPVIQDIHQLRDIYGPHGAESFAGQCQAVFAFAPGEWESAEWMSRRSGEEDVIVESASQSTGQPGVHRSYSIQRQRVWPPERILDLPPFHGLVWFHGQSKATPVYAAPYWTIPACKRLARPDPYHDEDAAGEVAMLPPMTPPADIDGPFAAARQCFSCFSCQARPAQRRHCRRADRGARCRRLSVQCHGCNPCAARAALIARRRRSSSSSNGQRIAQHKSAAPSQSCARCSSKSAMNGSSRRRVA
jgi:type IV secretion system protein VirD4